MHSLPNRVLLCVLYLAWFPKRKHFFLSFMGGIGHMFSAIAFILIQQPCHWPLISIMLCLIMISFLLCKCPVSHDAVSLGISSYFLPACLAFSCHFPQIHLLGQSPNSQGVNILGLIHHKLPLSHYMWG